MERADMPSRTVFRYEAEYDYPVLVIDPQAEVVPDETVHATDSAGQPLHVSDRREPQQTAAGMLGIIYTQGTNEERASELEGLKGLDQADVLRAELRARLLPVHAVAVVVYPHSIGAVWEK